MRKISALNVMVKQTTLLDSLDFGTAKWRVSMGGLIDRVHEAMKTSLMQRFI